MREYRMRPTFGVYAIDMLMSSGQWINIDLYDHKPEALLTLAELQGDAAGCEVNLKECMEALDRLEWYESDEERNARLG